MTQREQRLVRESFDAVREISGPLATLFYGRLFELAPEVRQMFRGDIRTQGGKLMEMLAAVVGHLDRLDELNPVLRDMGRRHAGYGVVASQYDVVAQALIWSLGHALEGSWSHDQKAAWRTVISKIAHEMKSGAASPPG